MLFLFGDPVSCGVHGRVWSCNIGLILPLRLILSDLCLYNKQLQRTWTDSFGGYGVVCVVFSCLLHGLNEYMLVNNVPIGLWERGASRGGGGSRTTYANPCFYVEHGSTTIGGLGLRVRFYWENCCQCGPSYLHSSSHEILFEIRGILLTYKYHDWRGQIITRSVYRWNSSYSQGTLQCVNSNYWPSRELSQRTHCILTKITNYNHEGENLHLN